MSDLSQVNREILVELAQQYAELPWYKRLFFPGKLTETLTQFSNHPHTATAWSVCDAYFNHTWFFQRWFFSCLQRFSNTSLMKALSLLHSNYLLMPTNTNLVLDHESPDAVLYTLEQLQEESLLNDDEGQAHFDVAMNFWNHAEKDDALAEDAETNPPAIRLNRSVIVLNILKELQEVGLLEGPKEKTNRNIIKHHRNLGSLLLATENLRKEGLLIGPEAQAHWDSVARHKSPIRMAIALSKLNKEGLLGEDKAVISRTLVAVHEDPVSVVNVLKYIYESGLFSGEKAQANWDIVLKHTRPMVIAQALKRLYESKLLANEESQAIWDAVVKHSSPDTMTSILIGLDEAGLLAGERAKANLELVMNVPDISFVVTIFKFLSKSGLLNSEKGQANWDAAMSYEDPEKITPAFTLLEDILVNQLDFEMIVGRPDPFDVAYILRCMRRAHLLNTDKAHAYRQVIMEQPYLRGFSNILFWIRDIEAIHTHFDNIMTYFDILCGRGMNEIWRNIPPGTFSEGHFIRMVEIARQHREQVTQGQNALRAYVNREFLRMQNEVNQDFNEAQSTHNASIFQSASQSATRLINHYRRKLSDDGLETVINELQEGIKTRLSSTTLLKEQAALRGLERITKIEYFHQDETSGVSIRQLLALSWLAIHDEEQREGELEDAQNQLIEGLYEIQRGYNLNAQGIDDGGPDRPICVGGTFNKLIEKLVGVHPDATLKLITPTMAGIKFKLIVIEEAKKYLTEQKKTQDITQLLDQLEKEGMDAIWKFISGAVAEVFLKEFKSLYTAKDEKFKGLLTTGPCVMLSERVLNDLRKPAVVTDSITHTPRFFQGNAVEEVSQGALSTITLE